MGNRKTYSEEYKVRALRLAEEKGIGKAAEELGIPNKTLYGWRSRVITDGIAPRRGDGGKLRLEEETAWLRERVKEREEEIRRLREKIKALSFSGADSPRSGRGNKRGS